MSGESNRVSWGTEPAEHQGGPALEIRNCIDDASPRCAHLSRTRTILASEGGIDDPVSSFGSSRAIYAQLHCRSRF